MAGEKLRVAHVFAGVEGGAWVFDQLRILRDQHGCDVVAVLAGTSGTLPDKCRAAGIPVKAIDFNTIQIWSFPWRLLKLALWLRRERIDVVQSHVMSSTMFARPAAWLADVPVRLTMVTGTYYMLAPFFRRIELRTCWMETGIVPSCEATARLYLDAGVPPGLICETLYYGPRAALWDPATAQRSDLRRRFGLGAETRLIGIVAVFYQRNMESSALSPPGTEGRLVKGHEDLIAAMPLILDEFPEARMLFIGKGWGPNGEEIETEMRELIAAAGMERHIIMTGYLEDIAGAYLDLDVSVQASLNENLGGTVESLLMARPTVATRVGGMPDAVVDGETGVLVEPSNPPDLARGICDLLRDPERGARLGLAGRARMLSRFTLETTGPGLAALYARQLSQARGSRRLSRLILRCASMPVRFLPELIMAMRTLVTRLTRLPLIYARHYGARMVPRPLRQWLRKITRAERRPHRAN